MTTQELQFNRMLATLRKIVKRKNVELLRKKKFTSLTYEQALELEYTAVQLDAAAAIKKVKPIIKRKESPLSWFETFKYTREALGLTIDAVAIETGLSGSFIQMLEGGNDQFPRAHTIWKLCRTYELDYREMLIAAGLVVKKNTGPAGSGIST